MNLTEQAERSETWFELGKRILDKDRTGLYNIRFYGLAQLVKHIDHIDGGREPNVSPVGCPALPEVR